VSTFELLKRAERIEAIAAAIYAACARQFASDEKVHALFVRLEAEEIQHAARVRLLAARYRSDSRLLARVSGAAELDACLAAAEGALAEVEAGKWAGDLPGVKARLAVLEERLSRAHAHGLAEDGDPGMRDFFLQLALQDEAHAQLLKDA
jgi:rubrerythrin